MKAGGAYLPLDPDYPPERTSYILEDSDCSLILTGRFPGNKPGTRAATEKIEIEIGSTNSLSPQNTQNLPGVGKSTDLAYVIYTSGSTGRPKGVMIQHRCLANFYKRNNRYHRFQPKGPHIIFNHHILRYIRFRNHIALNNRVCGNYRNRRWTIKCRSGRLWPCLKKMLTILQVTPSRLSMLIANEISANGLKFLKYLLVGGEAFPAPLLKKTRDRRQGKIYNMFGPTETTIWSTVKKTIGKTFKHRQTHRQYRYIYTGQENTLLPLGVQGTYIYQAKDWPGDI